MSQIRLDRSSVVGVDLDSIVAENPTGVSRVVKNLVLNLLRVDGGNRFRLYSHLRLPKSFLDFKNVEERVIEAKPGYYRYQLPLELLLNRPEILFMPSSGIPRFAPKKTIGCVYDLAFLKDEEWYQKSELKIQKRAVESVVRRAAIVLVPSKATANDLRQNFEVELKPLVLSPGITDWPAETDLDREALSKIGGKFLLYVGRLEARKNLVNLVRAYGLLRREPKQVLKLVLVGPRGFGYEEIKREISALGPIGRAIFELGFVDDSLLGLLYKEAEALVFLSQAEGFSLPILEAMAAKTPVLLSDIPIHREVAGSAAIYVNQNKPFEIAASLSRLLNTPSMQRSFISKGRSRISLYSWQKSAVVLKRVIDHLGRIG